MLLDVRQQKLDRLFETSTGVDLCTYVVNEARRVIEPQVAVRLSDPEQLRALAHFLRIQHRGNPSIGFSLGDYPLIFTPSNSLLTIQMGQFGLTLRAEGLWRYDAPLEDGPGLAAFLQKLGYPHIRDGGLPGQTFPEDPDLADWELPPPPPVDSVKHSLEHLQRAFQGPVEMAESLLIWCASEEGLRERYLGGREYLLKMLRRLPPPVLLQAMQNPMTGEGARFLREVWPETPPLPVEND